MEFPTISLNIRGRKWNIRAYKSTVSKVVVMFIGLFILFVLLPSILVGAMSFSCTRGKDIL